MHIVPVLMRASADLQMKEFRLFKFKNEDRKSVV